MGRKFQEMRDDYEQALLDGRINDKLLSHWRKNNDNNTEIDIDAKFTPLFERKPRFCIVAPRNESNILPKNPKKTDMNK